MQPSPQPIPLPSCKVDLAHRLAAIVPEFGSFHKGFAMAPASAVPVLDLHGAKDTTVPANVSLSADGYYYTTTDEIFNGGAYSKGWKAANGCEGPGAHWPTQWDGEDDFWCIAECAEASVVRCMWDGGHNWLFNNAKANGGLVTKCARAARGVARSPARGAARARCARPPRARSPARRSDSSPPVRVGASRAPQSCSSGRSRATPASAVPWATRAAAGVSSRTWPSTASATCPST